MKRKNSRNLPGAQTNRLDPIPMCGRGECRRETTWRKDETTWQCSKSPSTASSCMLRSLVACNGWVRSWSGWVTWWDAGVTWWGGECRRCHTHSTCEYIYLLVVKKKRRKKEEKNILPGARKVSATPLKPFFIVVPGVGNESGGHSSIWWWWSKERGRRRRVEIPGWRSGVLFLSWAKGQLEPSACEGRIARRRGS